MAIISSELVFKAPETVDDSSDNGGRVTNTTLVSGKVGVTFPLVFQAERIAGSQKWRKVFLANVNGDDLTLYYPKVWIHDVTPGDDYVIMALGTQRDTQGTKALTNYYGAGRLQSDVSVGGQTLVVDLEDNALKSGTYAIFRAGDLIRVHHESPSEVVQEMTIDTVTPDGSLPRVTITTVETLTDAHTVAQETKISSVLEPDQIEAWYENLVVTTAGDGDYDDTSYPIMGYNIGSKEITVTGTWSDATHATFVDDDGGSWGTWDTTSGDFSPTNPDTASALFTIYQAGLSGTFANGDTIVFDLHPSRCPIWEYRVVPAGAGSLAGDKVILLYGGESAS